MKLCRSGKLMAIAGVMVGLSLTANLVEAKTVAEAKVQVDMEYAAGNMDESTYNDLKAILDSAVDQTSMMEAQEAFNVLIAVNAGSSIDSEAANRMMGTFDGL